jgi:hypothetical protein
MKNSTSPAIAPGFFSSSVRLHRLSKLDPRKIDACGRFFRNPTARKNFSGRPGLGFGGSETAASFSGSRSHCNKSAQSASSLLRGDHRTSEAILMRSLHLQVRKRLPQCGHAGSEGYPRLLLKKTSALRKG